LSFTVSNPCSVLDDRLLADVHHELYVT